MAAHADARGDFSLRRIAAGLFREGAILCELGVESLCFIGGEQWGEFTRFRDAGFAVKLGPNFAERVIDESFALCSGVNTAVEVIPNFFRRPHAIPDAELAQH